jgi:hypothetical protein
MNTAGTPHERMEAARQEAEAAIAGSMRCSGFPAARKGDTGQSATARKPKAEETLTAPRIVPTSRRDPRLVAVRTLPMEMPFISEVEPRHDDRI